MKWRNGAGVSVIGTLFNAKTTESNYEVTTQTFTSNKYKASGLELEASFNRGDFHLNGGATFTRARITESNSAAQVGNKPRRQADLVWQLAPSFTFGPVDVGASIVGTTKSFGDDDNKITMPGYTVVNAFASYQISSSAQLGLGVNNLMNTLGYTEVEGDGHAARAVNGRSVRAGGVLFDRVGDLKRAKIFAARRRRRRMKTHQSASSTSSWVWYAVNAPRP